MLFFIQYEGGIYVLIDIHMHVIPGVDDGSESVEESLEMLRMAHHEGTDIIIATPHSFAFAWSPELPRKQFELLKEKAYEAQIPVQLFYGTEILCDRYSMEEILDNLHTGVYPTMNHTEYVLIEFSPYIDEDDAVYCTRLIKEAGYIPIIAHAERYRFMNTRSAALLRRLGARIQINVYSVYLEKQDWIKENARSLLQEKFADFAGSDAHGTTHRPPREASGIKYMYEHYDPDYISRVLHDNAWDILIHP